MDVGLSVLFQNEDWLRAPDDAPAGISDHDVYRREKTVARLAEPLGFDSIWSVEHHFTGYTMVPDVLQFLSFMAGQTDRIRLGTMVVVVPWHNPARLAGAICQLDNLSDGRLVLGLGRGLGRVEFEGLGVPMEESRGRFVEGAQLLLEGLEQGYVKYEGQFYRQPKRWLRPAPVRTFRGRSYASAISPESLDIMARLGIGLLIIPQKPWPTVVEDVARYREVFREVNGAEPPEPIVICQVYCDEDAGRARELGYRHIMAYYATVMRHYELAGEHFGRTAGYEYYSKTAAHLQAQAPEVSEQWYADLHVFGTPAECVERVAAIKDRIGCAEFAGMMSFGGMTSEDAVRNVRLFADRVMPDLRRMG